MDGVSRARVCVEGDRLASWRLGALIGSDDPEAGPSCIAGASDRYGADGRSARQERRSSGRFRTGYRVNPIRRNRVAYLRRVHR
jgi:hypothetical protein